MKYESQKNQFLHGEGDEWLRRNRKENKVSNKAVNDADDLTEMLENLGIPTGTKIKVVEIGCGQGLRLERLKRNKGWEVTGIDPSKKAIEEIMNRKIKGYVGTAENLPIENESVDLLIFGFCLYLCDRDDLFRIAAEAHRVLKPKSWLGILDFWSPYPKVNQYHHKEGIQTFKDDIPKMFTWHPYYEVTDHRLRHHTTRRQTDETNEWIAATIIRRSDADKKNYD